MGVDAAFLRPIPLFRDLGEALLVERHFTRGQVIFAEEHTGYSMYVVKDGRVKVSRWLPNGREVILAFHPAGDYFGEMALIDGQTLPATVTAVTDCAIVSLDRAQFLGLLRERSFTMALLRTLCARCREAWQQIELLTHHHAEARIRMALYQLCLRRGSATAAGVRIDIPLTHRELASIAGVSRETATRVLGTLVDQRVLTVNEAHFLVARPEDLLASQLLE
jgi:CRP/FNR family cyclic AMP-dependent transcriptional regulator